MRCVVVVVNFTHQYNLTFLIIDTLNGQNYTRHLRGTTTVTVTYEKQEQKTKHTQSTHRGKTTYALDLLTSLLGVLLPGRHVSQR